jgi:hypothetical protein
VFVVNSDGLDVQAGMTFVRACWLSVGVSTMSHFGDDGIIAMTAFTKVAVIINMDSTNTFKFMVSLHPSTHASHCLMPLFYCSGQIFNIDSSSTLSIFDKFGNRKHPQCSPSWICWCMWQCHRWIIIINT